MEEAVEICKLRLFLKLAAQLEPGQEIEPLPDIDFNIRSGNTLVGYASRDEVRRCMTQFGDGQMRLGVEDELQSYTRFEEAAENVDKAFQLFQQMQDDYRDESGRVPRAKTHCCQSDSRHCATNSTASSLPTTTSETWPVTQPSESGATRTSRFIGSLSSTARCKVAAST